MAHTSTPGSFSDWLASLDLASLATMPFPLERLLDGSVYYPASAFDCDPVCLLGHSFQSFVYVGYSTSGEDLERKIRHNGFRGYQVLGQRQVREKELAPTAGSRSTRRPRTDTRCSTET